MSMLLRSRGLVSKKKPVVMANPWISHQLVQKNTGSNTGVKYDFGFTPAAGSYLVAIGAGPVTFSNLVPSGWTTRSSQINSGTLYIFTKTATVTDTSLTVDHNGSGMANYPAFLDVYEFPAGSAFVKASVGHLNANANPLPQVTALTGTNLLFWLAVLQNGVQGSPATLVQSQGANAATGYQQGLADGSVYSANYLVSSAASSPAATYTGVNTVGTGEAITFAMTTP